MLHHVEVDHYLKSSVIKVLTITSEKYSLAGSIVTFS